MQSFYFEDERGIEGAKTDFSPFLGGPLVPEAAPGKSFENPRGPPRWPQARFTAFLQGAVATSLRAKKSPKKKCRKSEGATKMAASSIHCIFTGCRGHLVEAYIFL